MDAAAAGPWDDIVAEPRRWPAPPLPTTTVGRCLVLAALLHLLALLSLGSAPGGTARSGEGVRGRLNVVLGNGPPEPAAEPARPARTGAMPAEKAPPVAGPAPLGPAAATVERLPDRLSAPAPQRSASLDRPAPAAAMESPALRGIDTPTPRAAESSARSAAPNTATAAPAPDAALAAPAPDGVAGSAPVGPAGPDAGAQFRRDVASSPSRPSSAPPLDLEWRPRRGGELSGGLASGTLPLLPRPPDVKPKLAEDIEKAAKPDCRTAYSGLGLLAVVPLAIGAAGDGCKW